MALFIFTLLLFAAVMVIKKTFLIVQERESVVRERLGSFDRVLKPGFHFMVPIVHRAAYRQEAWPTATPACSCRWTSRGSRSCSPASA